MIHFRKSKRIFRNKYNKSKKCLPKRNNVTRKMKGGADPENTFQKMFTRLLLSHTQAQKQEEFKFTHLALRI